MPSPKPIIIVQGGQYGSEAKGAVAAFLCREREVKFACRTGAVNAGHTVYLDGKDIPFKMQQLPTGWAVGVPNLVIGPGALVHPKIFEEEVGLVRANGFSGEIHVDRNAGLHTEEHTNKSAVSGRHYSMGATGKGCSEALIDRIRLRGSGGKLFRDVGCCGMDTSELVNYAYDQGAQILLEGTQGSLLDLYLGPYPYVTHKPTQAATWIQEMGLSPRLHYEIAMVLRTYPIRVAGNSGPLPKETSWARLAMTLNTRMGSLGLQPIVSPDALRDWEKAYFEAGKRRGLHGWRIELFTQLERELQPELVSNIHREAFDSLPAPVQAELKKLFEFTTVTNKLRRIAEFDERSAEQAITWNRPDYIVLTFVNYLFPEIWGTTSWEEWPKATKAQCFDYLANLEVRLGTQIRYVSTGPRSENILRVLNGVR